jgi:transglutaminase-like putative cysteine protease
MVMGGMFEARLEPEDVAKEPGSGGDLFVFGMAPVDRPLGEAPKVKELALAVTGEGTAQLRSQSRQAVKPGEDGGIEIRIGAGHGTPKAAGAEEVAENLKETVGYPIRHESVRALALRAIGDAREPRQKVERLVQFVGDFIRDALRPESVDVPRLIREPSGDCSEHALLFVALARAAGVPAREVGGLMYMGDEVKAFGWHAWAEVALDGLWVEVDPTWNQMEPDATHILVGVGEEAQTRTLWAIGRLQLRVLDAK